MQNLDFSETNQNLIIFDKANSRRGRIGQAREVTGRVLVAAAKLTDLSNSGIVFNIFIVCRHMCFNIREINGSMRRVITAGDLASGP